MSGNDSVFNVAVGTYAALCRRSVLTLQTFHYQSLVFIALCICLPFHLGAQYNDDTVVGRKARYLCLSGCRSLVSEVRRSMGQTLIMRVHDATAPVSSGQCSLIHIPTHVWGPVNRPSTCDIYMRSQAPCVP